MHSAIANRPRKQRRGAARPPTANLVSLPRQRSVHVGSGVDEHESSGGKILGTLPNLSLAGRTVQHKTEQQRGGSSRIRVNTGSRIKQRSQHATPLGGHESWTRRVFPPARTCGDPWSKDPVEKRVPWLRLPPVAIDWRATPHEYSQVVLASPAQSTLDRVHRSMSSDQRHAPLDAFHKQFVRCASHLPHQRPIGACFPWVHRIVNARIQNPLDFSPIHRLEREKQPLELELQRSASHHVWSFQIPRSPITRQSSRAAVCRPICSECPKRSGSPNNIDHPLLERANQTIWAQHP